VERRSGKFYENHRDRKQYAIAEITEVPFAEILIDLGLQATGITGSTLRSGSELGVSASLWITTA
jgi:hypothetical protein